MKYLGHTGSTQPEIVCGYSMQTNAESVINAVTSIAYQCQIVVLHILSPADFTRSELVIVTLLRFGRYLDDWAARLWITQMLDRPPTNGTSTAADL